MKRVLVLVCLVLMFGLNVEAKVYGTNGYKCEKTNYKSGILLIGDSRTCQLWNYKKSGASVMAIWGGHYYTKSSSIDSYKNRKQIKKIVKSTVKKKGYCNVYLFATVNDYNGEGKSDAKASAKKVIKFAKSIRSYNKKAKVTIIGLIGSKGTDVSYYNKYLKSNLPRKVKLLSIKSCLTGENKGYDRDNLHYNKSTLKQIWKKLR